MSLLSEFYQANLQDVKRNARQDLSHSPLEPKTLSRQDASDFCLLERLPPPINKLLDVYGEVDIVADSVPTQLLMLSHQVVSHVAQQKHTALMEPPFGHFSTESLIVSLLIAATGTIECLSLDAVEL